MKRVAFTLVAGWTGGYNYLSNLFSALAEHQPGRISPILFLGEDCGEQIAPLAAIPGVEIVTSPGLNADRRMHSLALAILLGRDNRIHELFKLHRVDLAFEVAQYFGWRIGIPVIAWFPDFQHKALPDLFPAGACLKREIGFRAQVASSRTIMLSSEDARRDCERYYRSSRGHTRTVHFAVPPGVPLSFSAARSVADAYGLPPQFFFMPNQFWRHKNHLLVLEALSILKSKGQHIVVAASGKRAPCDNGFYPDLLGNVEKHGLQHEFRLLGLIPYEHIKPLMRACTAMLNPSLFEGWSTTVEEARALGTPMVLSDLAVHREQMGAEATYFERNSARSLADVLEHTVPLEESRRESLASEARVAAADRVRKYAENFANLVDDCIGQHSRRKKA